MQSDPIGLWGGPNTYLYGGANPLFYADPYGLFRWPFPDGVGEFFAGAGSYYNGFGRSIRHLSRSYGLFGPCERLRADEEDVVFQDFLQELRNNPTARDLARQAADRYVASHGTYLKGRVTAGVFTSVFFPVGTGLGVTTIALYGDARYAIERGADLYGALEATIGGDPLSSYPNPRRGSSMACECRRP